MADKVIRVAVYARVSTTEQAVEGTSINHQLEQLTGYCMLQGWEIFRQYVDPGFTGKDDNRPELKHLMADAELKLFSKVVVYKLDRMARKLRLLLELEEKLKEYDVSLNSVKETLDTSTPIGRTVFQMLGLVSEWERQSIIERTSSGRIQRYKAGLWASGKPPYGYSYDKVTKKLYIDKDTEDKETEKVRIIRHIFDLYDSGKSLANIADTLNEENVQPRGKNYKGWRASAVRNILINPVYKGALVVNRHSHISSISKVDMSKAITIPVPPIVTEEAWQIAQDHFTANKRVQPKKARNWLLQGLVICGLCGLSYRSEQRGNLRYYSCRGKLKQRHLDGSPRCKTKHMRADWLEEQVWQRIKEIINDPNKLEQLLQDTIDRLTGRVEELEAMIMPIDKQLAQIGQKKARLADSWVVDNMNEERFRELQQSLDKEEARLKSIRNEIDPAQIAELESTRGSLSFWQAQMQTLAWNCEDENEEGKMVKVLETPHKNTLKIVELGDQDIGKIIGFPTTRRELLDKLQVHVVVFNDIIKVNSLFTLEPIDCQKCTSARTERERKRMLIKEPNQIILTVSLKTL